MQMLFFLHNRGFYPKGGGEVIIAPAPLKELYPVNITDPGRVERVRIHAFVAGAVAPKVHVHAHFALPLPSYLHTFSLPPSPPHPSHQVSRRLVHSARGLIQSELPNVKIDVNEVQETPATAFGNSSGIM